MTPETRNVDSFCSRGSIAAGEPLEGSAVRADCWILLEHDGPWDRKAERSPMAEALRERIALWLEAIPDGRLQLVRRPGESRRDGARLLVGRSDGPRPWLAELAVERVEDLLDVDVPGWLGSGTHTGAREVPGPVFLVCTHGRRDRCCAKWGTELFRQVTSLAPGKTWQTTHLGGHRFAPTMLVLPEGVQYGRIDASQVGRILDAHERGELGPLDEVRGRTTLDAPAQVADVVLRRQKNLLALDAVVIESVQGGNPEWTICMRARDVPVRVSVRADRDFCARRAKSCGGELEGLAPLRARVEAPTSG